MSLIDGVSSYHLLHLAHFQGDGEANVPDLHHGDLKGA